MKKPKHYNIKITIVLSLFLIHYFGFSQNISPKAFDYLPASTTQNVIPLTGASVRLCLVTYGKGISSVSKFSYLANMSRKYKFHNPKGLLNIVIIE